MAEDEPVTVAGIERIAAARLPPQVWRFYAHGADGQHTLRRNKAVFDEILLRPRVLRNVTNIDTSTTIFGKRYDIPIAIALNQQL